VLLEDVERIEVIRGPGGTLWGANAVNGVINIITKKANDTQGVYAQGGGGSHERDMEAFRVGGAIGEDLHYRIYGKHFERGPNFDPAGLVDDAWRQRRVGFRADWEPGRDKSDFLTVQGDHYDGDTDGGSSSLPLDPTLGENLTGDNLLMRWRHVYDEDSNWSLQVYYDRYLRDDLMQTQSDKTYDVEFQHRFPMADRHSVTWGAGFRSVESLFIGGDQFTTYFPSPYLTTNYTSQFLQDEIAVIEDRLTFTLGCKLEQNPYTGLEYQPTARLLWSPDSRRSAWAAFSRAVKTPSRAVRQITSTFPPYAPGVYPRAIGNRGVGSEAVLAYEIGYREQTTKRFSWDVATFYNAYDHLLAVLPGSLEPEPPPPLPPERLIVPLWIDNGARGETYGIELCGNYAVSEKWTLYAQYTALQIHLFADPPEMVDQGTDPHNQVYVRSAWTLREDLEFDLMARYVDRLTEIGVPSYISMDARLAWRPRQHLELAVVGQNLLQQHHWEYAGNTSESPTYATEVPRGVYGTVSWRY
jgi:iron complex outermembrane receptor protein